MSESLIKWAYNVFVGNSRAKAVLCYLAYDCTVSINKLSFYCEYPPRSIKISINYLINNGFIYKRKGVIPGYTNDEYDNIYQYKLLNTKRI